MSLREYAYASLLADDGYVIGLAEENVPGYRRVEYGPYESEEAAQPIVDALNKRIGVSPRRALLIVGSSMFPAPPTEHARRRASWDALEVTP